MKNNKTNQILSIVLLTCATGIQSMWNMQDFPERKRRAAATEEEQPAQAQTHTKALQAFQKLPGEMQTNICQSYPLSKEALKMLNEYTFRTSPEGEIRAKEGKEQKQTTEAQEKRPLLKSFTFSRDFKRLVANIPTSSGTHHADAYISTIFDIENSDFNYKDTLVLARGDFPALNPDGARLAMFHNQTYIFLEDLNDENRFQTNLPWSMSPYFSYQIHNSPSMVFSNDGSLLHVYAVMWPGTQHIITYSINTKAVTNRVDFDIDFLRDKKIMGLLPDGSCIFEVFSMKPDQENPEGPQIQDRPIGIARYNPATRELIKLVDFIENHYCTTAFDYVNNCIFLEATCDIKKIALLDPITQEIVYTNNPKDFRKENESISDSDSDSDNDSDDEAASGSIECSTEHYTGLETVNIRGNYRVEGFSNGVLKFKRIKPITFDDPKTQTFDPKLMPFIDWLYTTQKERNFKPLTLTQAGFKHFKQLDEFSQTALMRNLNLRRPTAQASTQVESKAQTETKAAAKVQEKSSCTIM